MGMAAVALQLGGRVARLGQGILRGQGTGFAFAQTLTTQVFVLVLNLATGVLTARLLGPEGRGQLAALSIWPPFVAALVASGLSAALVHQIRSAKSEDRGAVLGAALTIGLLLGGVGAATTFTLMPLAMGERYSNDLVSLAPIAAAVTILCLLILLIRSALTAFGRFSSFNLAAWADPALYCAGLILATLWAPLDATRAVFCLWLATAVCFCGIAIYLFSFGQVTLRGARRFFRPLGSFMARAAGGSILGTMVAHMDRLVLLVLLPAEAFGLYVVAFSLSRMLVVVQTAVSAVALPALAGQSPAAASALYQRMFRLVLCLLTVAGIAAWALGGFVLSVLYGKDFSAAQPIFMILVLEAAVACLSQVTAQLYMAMGRPGFTSLAQLVSFAVLCTGLLTLVPLLGAPGAALAILLSSSLRLTMLLFAIPGSLQLPRPALSPIRAELSSYVRGVARL
jgi:O-antigen/teichoic acid export membrane protein